MRVSMMATAAVLLVGGAQAARAQGWKPPGDSERCPSKWGPNDQRGAGNHMKPEGVNGIHLLENLRLDELAARRAYEFALVVEPLKIQDGTGSTVAPIAIR